MSWYEEAGLDGMEELINDTYIETETNAKRKVWVGINGNEHKMSDMSEKYITNVIKFLQKRDWGNDNLMIEALEEELERREEKRKFEKLKIKFEDMQKQIELLTEAVAKTGIKKG